MPLQPPIPKPGSPLVDRVPNELMHAIRNQLGLIAGHAGLLLAESTVGSKSHESAEIISRACLAVGDQLLALDQRLSDSAHSADSN